MRKPNRRRTPASHGILAALLLATPCAGAQGTSGTTVDIGPGLALVPDGAAFEIRHRDAVGGVLSTGPGRPAGTVTSTIVLLWGRIGCEGDCGDARAVPSVGWAPSLPWAFAIEAGPPRIRVRGSVPPPGASI